MPNKEILSSEEFENINVELILQKDDVKTARINNILFHCLSGDFLKYFYDPLLIAMVINFLKSNATVRFEFQVNKNEFANYYGSWVDNVADKKFGVYNHCITYNLPRYKQYAMPY